FGSINRPYPLTRISSARRSDLSHKGRGEEGARRADIIKRNNHRSLGSSASRRPSPTRLNDSTTRKIASPGHSAIHGALVRKRCAELSMLPQEGAGGC